jgi:hypothetical protein
MSKWFRCVISCTLPNDKSIQGIVIKGEQGFGVLAGPQNDTRSTLIVFPARLVPTTKRKGEFHVTDKTIHC